MQSTAAFAGEGLPGRPGTAVLDAMSGHSLMERAVETTGVTRGMVRYPNARAGAAAAVAEGEKDLVCFAKEVFYPCLWEEPARRYERLGAAYAVHHWRRSR